MTVDHAPTEVVEHELAQASPAILEHLNTHHDDALLLVGRVLGDCREATSSRAVALDPRGVELVLDGPSGPRAVRVPFSRPIGALDEVSREAFALVERAREASGEPGETTAERELRQLRATRTMLATVAAVEDVHPRLRRITFAGGDLRAFRPLGPDTFLYVLLPPPGRSELTIDQSFSWEAYRTMPDEERPVGAYYTVRAWRPDVAELDMLFVLHEPAGPASAWAAQARRGDPVALWGPREAFEPPAGTAGYVLVADDTGLPAVAAILEWLPAEVPVVVVAEVDHPGERLVLPERPRTEVHWTYREGAGPGTHPARLLEAVRAVSLPTGPLYVWGGGESRAMTAVRRHVRGELGLGREQVSLVAYWRHAESPLDDAVD